MVWTLTLKFWKTMSPHYKGPNHEFLRWALQLRLQPFYYRLQPSEKNNGVHSCDGDCFKMCFAPRSLSVSIGLGLASPEICDSKFLEVC